MGKVNKTICINNYVRQWMEIKGVTQQAIADNWGISRQGLYKILSTIERDGGTIQTNAKFAEYLGIELWQLFISPEQAKEIDLLRQGNKGNFVCPHCGKPITIKIE